VDVHGRNTESIAQAARFGLPLEIAVHSTNIDDLAFIQEAAATMHCAVARWIVYGMNAPRAATVLHGEVGAGTNANFAELNRDRDRVKDASFATFSLNPQVHGSEERTMIECLEGQGDAVASARSFARQVVVSPVTLLARANTATTEQPADPRQATPFVAAWTLGSLASLITSGAASITYFEAAGPRGIIGTPVETLLAAIASFAPEYAYACEVSAPLSVAALGLGNGRSERVVVANLRPEPTEIEVPTTRGTLVISLEPYAIQWIEN
jgi:hypothetical protein